MAHDFLFLPPSLSPPGPGISVAQLLFFSPFPSSRAHFPFSSLIVTCFSRDLGPPFLLGTIHLLLLCPYTRTPTPPAASSSSKPHHSSFIQLVFFSLSPSFTLHQFVIEFHQIEFKWAVTSWALMEPMKRREKTSRNGAKQRRGQTDRDRESFHNLVLDFFSLPLVFFPPSRSTFQLLISSGFISIEWEF